MTLPKVTRTKKRRKRIQSSTTGGLVGLGLSALLFLVLCLWFDDGSAGKEGQREMAVALPPVTSGSEWRRLQQKKKPKVVIPKAKATIAYMITLTECQADGLLDGAAVLAHSIHLNSIRNYAESHSQYDYKLYAVVHPQAAPCTPTSVLEHYNYTVLIQDSPVLLRDMRNKKYVNRLRQNGCCGEREFLKLYALTLHQHEIVVSFDMDSLLLKPLDDLADAMLLPDDAPKQLREHAMFARDRVVTRRIHAYFTRDYIAGEPGKWRVVDHPMQGGFWMVRPNQTAFEEFCRVIRQSHFDSGWHNTDKTEHYPSFYGAPSIQGLVAWYYGYLYPEQHVELNHCRHNNQVYAPKKNGGKCIVPQSADLGGNGNSKNAVCQDCRTTPLDEVYSWHGTWCGKPWECQMRSDWHPKRFWRCQQLLHLWYQHRHDLEGADARLPPPPTPASDLERHSFGYCQPQYVPMKNPSLSQNTSVSQTT